MVLERGRAVYGELELHCDRYVRPFYHRQGSSKIPDNRSQANKTDVWCLMFSDPEDRGTPRGTEGSTKAQNKNRPVWASDDEVTNCLSCQTAFTAFNRKHHCRLCGQIFCGTCSSQSSLLPDLDYLTPVRVCDCCFQLLNAKSLAGSDNVTLQLSAARDLAKLAGQGRAAPQVLRYALKQLVFLARAPDVTVRAGAAEIAALLALHDDCRSALGSTPLLPLLIAAASAPPPADPACLSALTALAALCQDDSNRPRIVAQAGAVSGISAHASGPRGPARDSAVTVLMSLAHNDSARVRLLEERGHLPLLALMRARDGPAEELLAACAAVAARAEGLQRRLVEDGALQAVREQLVPPAPVLSSVLPALRLLSLLLEPRANQTAAVAEGLLPVLCNLTVHEHEDVRSCAVGVLDQLTSSGEHAAAVCAAVQQGPLMAHVRASRARERVLGVEALARLAQVPALRPMLAREDLQLLPFVRQLAGGAEDDPLRPIAARVLKLLAPDVPT